MGIARKVKWNAEEIKRDSLTDATRNTLGSTLTVFQVPDFAVNELVQGNKPVSDIVPEVPVSGEEDEVVSNPLRDMEMIVSVNRLPYVAIKPVLVT